MSVDTERLGRVLLITMRREHKRNAIDASITAGLDAALNDLQDDPGLWCGILSGGPTVFSAGADLAAGPGDPTPRGEMAGIIRRHRTKPLIAAVEGHAIGGGMEMVLCCDLVVAASSATFGLPEVKRGLMPDFGGAFRAARLLLANVAREMLLTGDSIPAERAERLGFVNLLTDPGCALEGAITLARRSGYTDATQHFLNTLLGHKALGVFAAATGSPAPGRRTSLRSSLSLRCQPPGWATASTTRPLPTPCVNVGQMMTVRFTSDNGQTKASTPSARCLDGNRRR